MSEFMRTALVLAASAVLLLITDVAAAQSTRGMLTKTCIGSGNTGTCIYLWGEPPEMAGTAKIIRVPRPKTPQEQAEFDERDRQWVSICEPVIVLDQMGVSRYTYSPACQNGVPVGNGRRP